MDADWGIVIKWLESDPVASDAFGKLIFEGKSFQITMFLLHQALTQQKAMVKKQGNVKKQRNAKKPIGRGRSR